MKNDLSRIAFQVLLCLTLILASCSDDTIGSADSGETLTEFTRGSGFFEYTTFNDKIMRIYYHIPSNSNTETKLLFAFHGNGRNAKDYRNAMMTKADQYNFIVIAPEFSSVNFPGGDAYNLGNVFLDGDNPSSSTLNPEDEWTFSVVEPLFDYVKQNINNSSSKYQVFGHSAGGQFVHRFAMFKPNARYDKIVASASGWYTVTDLTISYPYGFKTSPLETVSLENLFQKQLIVQVGSLDNDPNTSSLRHNEIVDLQGLDRLARAQYFYDEASLFSQNSNLEFQWELHVKDGADHNYQIASQNGADLIFN